MSLLDTTIRLKAVEFNVLRQLFPPIEGTTIYFLQLDGTIKNYKLTGGRAGMTSGWNDVTNKFQQTRELHVATAEANFWQVLTKSSHIAIGTHVFKINRASAMPPSERYPYYTVAIEATGETYT